MSTRKCGFLKMHYVFIAVICTAVNMFKISRRSLTVWTSKMQTSGSVHPTWNWWRLCWPSSGVRGQLGCFHQEFVCFSVVMANYLWPTNYATCTWLHVYPAGTKTLEKTVLERHMLSSWIMELCGQESERWYSQVPANQAMEQMSRTCKMQNWQHLQHCN